MTRRGRLRVAVRSVAWCAMARLRALPIRWLAVAVAALTIGIPSAAGAAVELRAFRIGVTPERTRIVLDLSPGRFTHSHTVVGDTAIVIRLPGARTADAFRCPAHSEGLFRSLRVDASHRNALELAIAFAAPATTKVFSVDAEKGLPPRLVIDLVAKKGSQPISVPKPPVSPSVSRPSEPSTETGSRVDPSPRTVASDATSGPPRAGPRVVVIDPGHGGADPGAVGKGVREKDVCLDVAKRLAAALNRAPGYRAVISRSDDRRVALAERMRFAEREGADLFVSIHVNAARSSRASGAEVFFLSIGAATDRAAAELARLENEADPDLVVEEDEALRGLPFAVDLRQSDTLLRSSRIAEVVLDVLTARKLAESRGVKQAGFAVLKSFQVPSILVEVGFISSPSERKKLKSADHRQNLADALAAGVRRYFDNFAPARGAP